MADTLGATRDLHLVEDMDLEASEVTGMRALAERLVRRLTTPKGYFPWWPNEGYCVPDALLGKQPLWVIKTAIESECARDEQVERVVVTVELSPDKLTLLINFLILAKSGTFKFTMSVTEAAGNLIAFQAA